MAARHSSAFVLGERKRLKIDVIDCRGGAKATAAAIAAKSTTKMRFRGGVYEVNRLSRYRLQVLLLTFVTYTCYHMSRKSISVVKTRLLNCTGDNGELHEDLHPDVAPEQEESACTSFICE